MKLDRRFVEKPWGRIRLPPAFGPTDGRKIGEIWFDGPADLPLLAKYIFTGERLSIQVHPDDEQAHLRGLAHGKTESWYILDAEPGAVIGLGLTGEFWPDEVRRAALDGSIEQMIAWRTVRSGDFFLVPAGTVHAIGGGVSLLEFQQNLDVTYRLFDYGRRRELHVEDAVSVAQPRPYPSHLAQHICENEERMLVDDLAFQLVHSHGDALEDRQRWIIPLEGKVSLGPDVAGVGDCLLAEPGDQLECDASRMLIGAKP